MLIFSLLEPAEVEVVLLYGGTLILPFFILRLYKSGRSPFQIVWIVFLYTLVACAYRGYPLSIFLLFIHLLCLRKKGDGNTINKTALLKCAIAYIIAAFLILDAWSFYYLGPNSGWRPTNFWNTVPENTYVG